MDIANIVEISLVLPDHALANCPLVEEFRFEGFPGGSLSRAQGHYNEVRFVTACVYMTA